MLTSMLLGAAIATPGAPIPADAAPAATGPAPWVLYLKSDANGRAQVMVYKTQTVNQSRAVSEIVDGKPVTKVIQEQIERTLPTYVMFENVNAKFTTAQGGTLTLDSVMKRAKEGVVLLVSADGKPVSRNWLKTVDPEAVIVTSESLVGVMAPRATTVAPTAAPRLVLLGTSADGKVHVPYNPAADGAGGYNGRNRVVFINNGNGAQPMFLNEEGYYSPYGSVPATTEAPVKALEDVKFEAYTLNGKSVNREDALQHLKAGGYVVIAGDNRVPDESYLKQFRGEMLVLVSAELINVPTGTAKGKPGANAPAPAVLPAVRPVPALRIAPLKVAPAALKQVAPAPAEKK